MGIVHSKSLVLDCGWISKVISITTYAMYNITTSKTIVSVTKSFPIPMLVYKRKQSNSPGRIAI